MSKNSAKITSNFGESISTHDHLQPVTSGAESGKKLNEIQVIKTKNEDILIIKSQKKKNINYIINF